MQRIGVIITSGVVLGLATITPAIAQTTPAQSSLPIEEQVAEVVSRLVGVMDTSAQAAASSTAPSVRMTTCEVQLTDASETDPATYLYQEQAIATRLEQPYRQRFLKIAPSDDRGNVQSTSYRPIDESQWIGLCDRPFEVRQVEAQDLASAHCSVFLRRVEDDYIGETQLGGCPSNYRGAVRVTNQIVLRATGMETRDRGLDINGNLVWGSTGEPYRFERRSP